MIKVQPQGEEGMSQPGAGWTPVGVGREEGGLSREASRNPGNLRTGGKRRRGREAREMQRRQG